MAEKPMIVRNRSLKISPGGVVTLPVSARKTLRMEPKRGARVTVALDGGRVLLRATTEKAGTRISPKGQMEMVGTARELLEQGEKRHYWLELDDAAGEVAMVPFEAVG